GFLDRVEPVRNLCPGRFVLPAPFTHAVPRGASGRPRRPPTPLNVVDAAPGEPAGVVMAQSMTSTPIDRAVPRTEAIAASTESVLRSGSFSRAISSTCLLVTVPTFVFGGSPDPLAMLAARLSRTGTGGVFVTNE